MPHFLSDLSRYGPQAGTVMSLQEAQAYCALLARSHYENFNVVGLLTPRTLRPAFEAIYAFCRWSDDLGDEIGDSKRSQELLRWWRQELHTLYRTGQATHPVYLALSPIIKAFSIPIEPFDDLISAFEQDQVVTHYDRFDQLLDYCKRSANPVGRLILHLGNAATEENLRLSDATCTGLQLANFWQDVSRDLDIGRVYLPKEDRSRFGYSDAELFDKCYTTAFADLMAFEVARTRAFFQEGMPLADRLQGRLSLAIEMFNRGGLAILDRIERQQFDVWTRRPVVSKAAKLRITGTAFVSRSRSWLISRTKSQAGQTGMSDTCSEPQCKVVSQDSGSLT